MPPYVAIRTSLSLAIALSSASVLSAQPPARYDAFQTIQGQIQVNLPKPFQIEPVPRIKPAGLPGGNALPRFNVNTIEEQNNKLLRELGVFPGRAAPLLYESSQRAMQQADLERELMEEQFYKAHAEWWIKTKSYRKAYEDLTALNPDSFSLARAQFIVENAYYDNQFEYAAFTRVIDFYAGVVKKILQQEGLRSHSNMALNYGIQKLFQQNNTAFDKAAGKTITVKPFRYDFTDWKGEKEYSQLFTLKLLLTGKGQCNSMPRWYLILAERLGAKAWLSLAPQHSFIRFPDTHNNLTNFETTNGTIVSTNWLLQSGFINANALKSKTYLDTLSRRQLFGQCLADLLLGYMQKIGYDDFAEQIRQKILEISPRNSTALIVEANIKTQAAIEKIIQAGRPPVKELINHPEAYQAWLNMHAAYEKIDATGYQDMPPEAYQQWLRSIEQEKKKQETRELTARIQREIQQLKKVKVTIVNKPKE